jgi:glucosyl-3-phosphoglycerate phosphatase
MLLIRHGQSQFNVIFSVTREDPGISDPELTDEGRQQIADTAAVLRRLRDQGEADIRRLITSPYIRALQTAAIIAEALDLPVTVEALCRERAAFTCDIGTSPRDLRQRFPRLSFDHLDDPWWHDLVTRGVAESEETVDERSAAFRHAMAQESDFPHLGVITHWGFIKSLTGVQAANGEIVRLPLA